MISHRKIRDKYLSFFVSRGHKIVPPISIVPQGDPTTLFTGSGMQPMIPYLLGDTYPLGNRICNIQPCFRSQDIEEVGDNRHTTMFEMMGNWSFGDYFKEEQLSWVFKFLVDKEEGLGLDPSRLYVTVYKGDESIGRDDVSILKWTELFKSVNINAEIGKRIFLYNAKTNWWSRAGEPKKMPIGEPGGPDSEVFYLFDKTHNEEYGEICHPNCDCGRFLEIGNSVFMEYIKQKDGTFSKLPKKNVDFGGGLERLCAVVNNSPDVFKTDLYLPLIKNIEKITNSFYEKKENSYNMRRIADHLKASIFLIKDGVFPANKEHGYFLRRLLRRAFMSLRSLQKGNFNIDQAKELITPVLNIYESIYFRNNEEEIDKYFSIIYKEAQKFNLILNSADKKINSVNKISGKDAFNLYQSYGIPFEITEELAKEKGINISYEDYLKEMKEHKNQSRELSSGKFKGGLADSSEQTIKYHTVTHILHQVLREMYGEEVRQEGSNITGDRLRFDYRFFRIPTKEEIEEIEGNINNIVKKNYPVRFVEMDKEKAKELGALSFFREKYPEKVKVYYIGEKEGDIKDAFSKEFCGGPHVNRTSEIGKLKVDKVKKIGSNVIRIYIK